MNQFVTAVRLPPAGRAWIISPVPRTEAPQLNSSSQSTIALLVDYENVAQAQAAGLDELVQHVSREGTLVIRRAYANWTRFACHKHSLRDAGFEMIDLPSVNGKNAVDIKLVVDALEIAFTKQFVDTFVIVSGDSDFIPLITKLNELNRRAWLYVGTHRPPAALAKFCFRWPHPQAAQPQPAKTTTETSPPLKSAPAKTAPAKTAPAKTMAKAAAKPPGGGKSKLKIGPTIPNNFPVRAPTAELAPAHVELFGAAIHICDQVAESPMPLNWLLMTAHALDPDFKLAHWAGSAKRPMVRLAEHLQRLGMLETHLDPELANHVFAAGPQLAKLPIDPTCHPRYQMAVDRLLASVRRGRDERFRVRTTIYLF